MSCFFFFFVLPVWTLLNLNFQLKKFFSRRGQNIYSKILTNKTHIQPLSEEKKGQNGRVSTNIYSNLNPPWISRRGLSKPPPPPRSLFQMHFSARNTKINQKYEPVQTCTHYQRMLLSFPFPISYLEKKNLIAFYLLHLHLRMKLFSNETKKWNCVL